MIGNYKVPVSKPVLPSYKPQVSPTSVNLFSGRHRSPIRADMGIRGFLIGAADHLLSSLKTHGVNITNRRVNEQVVEIHVQAKTPVTQEAEDRAEFV